MSSIHGGLDTSPMPQLSEGTTAHCVVSFRTHMRSSGGDRLGEQWALALSHALQDNHGINAFTTTMLGPDQNFKVPPPPLARLPAMADGRGRCTSVGILTCPRRWS